LARDTTAICPSHHLVVGIYHSLPVAGSLSGISILSPEDDDFSWDKAPSADKGEMTMSANPAPLPNPYSRPELVPFTRETAPQSKESENQSGQTTESHRRAKSYLSAIDFEVNAIDFEVASALSLCVGWHDRQDGDIYLIRTLQRIAEHMKALQAIQESLSQHREGPTTAELRLVNRGK
jgi:hypothetical protein